MHAIFILALALRTTTPIFVAKTGNDANACTKLSPCKTLSRARLVAATYPSAVIIGGHRRMLCSKQHGCH